MKNLLQKGKDVFDAKPGADAADVIAEAIELSANRGYAVTFTANGVTVNVLPDSDPTLVYRDWWRAFRGCIEPNVGPHPSPTLTDEEKANDNRIMAENERKQEERLKGRRQASRAKWEALRVKLAEAPPIEVRDREAWQRFSNLAAQSDEEMVILDVAECWARLMQLEISRGRKIEEVAEDTLCAADPRGITGCMRAAVVSILAQCWVHGEDLRQWHNQRVKLRGDPAERIDGVLNPATLGLR